MTSTRMKPLSTYIKVELLSTDKMPTIEKEGMDRNMVMWINVFMMYMAEGKYA